MPMSPDQIKAELEKRGISYEMIARRARPKRLSRSTIFKNVHQVPTGKSAKARRLIAKAIERTPEEVFGNAA